MKFILEGVSEVNYREDENGNIIREDGIVIPETKRTRCEVYSRVVGYLRPVSQWNAGKKEEFKDRKVFDHRAS